MPESGKIEQLTSDVKEYLMTNLEIVKLQATERTSVVGSGLLTAMIIGAVGFMFLLVLSLGAGYYLSDLFGNSYAGFAIIAGFYLMVGLVLYIGRKKMLEEPFRNQIIRKILRTPNP